MTREIRIIPSESIGVVNIGDTKDTVRQKMKDCDVALKYSVNNQFSKRDSFYEGDFFVHYDPMDAVSLIEVAYSMNDYLTVLWNDIPIFSTEADALIQQTRKYAEFIENDESNKGYTYVFDEFGVAYWRPGVFNKKDEAEEWFLELSCENQADERKHLYFESVSVFRKGGWSSIVIK